MKPAITTKELKYIKSKFQRRIISSKNEKLAKRLYIPNNFVIFETDIHDYEKIRSYLNDITYTIDRLESDSNFRSALDLQQAIRGLGNEFPALKNL